ncbi:MAG TPA: hypothetical protein H9811_07715 [Candidatus Gemmiger excrementigallinarum]|uniref:Uncharacterized protein n=1 Tax=Candidatus Gemmiger excrementigallinarum TaxID=2838609 RepID=A0A9D2ERD6_9FIRM|nr:hypothetical protein [Candidatus Gemmiger excrementigallinarum]
MTDQKGTEKVAASSEARGTAWGLHAPKTPKEEVAHAKTGKNAWKDCFSCRFGGAPLTIRACPNPRGGKDSGFYFFVFIFVWSFFGSFFAKKEQKQRRNNKSYKKESSP